MNICLRYSENAVFSYTTTPVFLISSSINESSSISYFSNPSIFFCNFSSIWHISFNKANPLSSEFVSITKSTSLFLFAVVLHMNQIKLPYIPAYPLITPLTFFVFLQLYKLFHSYSHLHILFYTISITYFNVFFPYIFYFPILYVSSISATICSIGISLPFSISSIASVTFFSKSALNSLKSL